MNLGKHEDAVREHSLCASSKRNGFSIDGMARSPMAGKHRTTSRSVAPANFLKCFQRYRHRGVAQQSINVASTKKLFLICDVCLYVLLIKVSVTRFFAGLLYEKIPCMQAGYVAWPIVGPHLCCHIKAVISGCSKECFAIAGKLLSGLTPPRMNVAALLGDVAYS